MAASYPEAFLSHLRPCLFVAGLEAWPAPTGDGDAASADPFVGLAASLRRAFVSKRGFQIWDPSRGTAPEFHAVLVQKVRPILSARLTDRTPAFLHARLTAAPRPSRR